MSSTASVQLHISGTNLKDKDFFSKSDPFAAVFVKENNSWKFVGRTETIDNNLNPAWSTAFKLPYFFEEVQEVKVEVYDEDKSKSANLKDHDLIGETVFTLASIMANRGKNMQFQLNSKKHKTGTLNVRSEEISNSADVLKIQFAAKELTNLDGLFGKSDPYLLVCSSLEDGSWAPVLKTETVKNNLNPEWKLAEVSLSKLCNGDYNRPLKFEVFDDDGKGKAELIGACNGTLLFITEHPSHSFDLINEKTKEKKGAKYKNSGTLRFPKLEIQKNHTFIEYVRGGCEVSLIVGIDYTSSNSLPSDPKSLHYLHPQNQNMYQQAVTAATNVLQSYDLDKKYPVFGFGGAINGVVSHCFPLTMNPAKPEVQGVEGIHQIYAQSLNVITLSGPTMFTPLIEMATQIASKHADQKHQKYYVLLIVTDGVIVDMQQTIDALVAASKLPLSVVIVGVGSEDFTTMKALDADGKLLKSSTGEVASRDIVQFVDFKISGTSMSRLNKDTLAEIPAQLVAYMKQNKIIPSLMLPEAFQQSCSVTQPPPAPQF